MTLLYTAGDPQGHTYMYLVSRKQGHKAASSALLAIIKHRCIPEKLKEIAGY